MVANVRGYTPNYGFKLINFDTPRWHTLEYANWSLIDALLTTAGVGSVEGEWANSTPYLAGMLVIDVEENTIYRCEVAHTSRATGTFADDRAINPENWLLFVEGVPIYRDAWAPSTIYAKGDIVHPTPYAYYLCTEEHTSSAAFATDVAYWVKVFDATQVVTDATAAKDAAQAAAVVAEDARDDAIVAKDGAVDAAESAAASADSSASTQGAFKWNYDYDTTVADPGVGEVRFNNANMSSVTVIMLSAQSADISNPDVSEWIVTWDDSTNPAIKGTVYVRKAGAPQNFAVFNVTGGVSDLGTWLQVGVTFVTNQGGFLPLDPLTVAFSRAGNQGAAGPGGGDMYSVNNLSDVANVTTSITNLGLGPTSVPTFAQINITNAATTDAHVVNKGFVDANYVNVTGDDITGPVSIKTPPSTYALLLQKGATVQDLDFVGRNVDGFNRWTVRLGDQSPETGGDAGSLFNVYSWNDNNTNFKTVMSASRVDGLIALYGNPTNPLHAATKNYVDVAMTTAGGDKLPLAGGTLTGLLRMEMLDPQLFMIKGVGAGHGNDIYGYAKTGAGTPGTEKARWLMRLGGAAGETGGNAGSDFELFRYDDIGNSLGNSLTIQRGTGNTYFGNWVVGAYFHSTGGRVISNGPNNNPSVTMHNGAVGFGWYVGTDNILHAGTAYTTGDIAASVLTIDSYGSINTTGSITCGAASVYSLSCTTSLAAVGTATFYSYVNAVGGRMMASHASSIPSVSVWYQSGTSYAFGMIGTGDNRLALQQVDANGTPIGTVDAAMYVSDYAGNTKIRGTLTLGGTLYPAQSGTSIAYSAGTYHKIEIQSNHPSADAFIAFHKPGAFACNFGLDPYNNFAYGGWSFGAVQYQLWSSRDVANIVQTCRMVYQGDYTHASGTGIAEPYGSGCATGFVGLAVGNLTVRYRALQAQMVGGGWVGFSWA